MKEVIEEWTSGLTSEEAWKIMQEHGVPGAPVSDVRSVAENPHTAARGMLVELEQPGAGTIKIFGSALKAQGSEIRTRGPAPALGQDNRWFLEEVLGKSPEEAGEILGSGAMG